MALFENGVLKSSVQFALWGLGIYVGLRVVGPLLVRAAKPLSKEAEKGYQCLRSRLMGDGQGEPPGEQAETEIEIGEQAAAGAGVRAAMVGSTASTTAVAKPAPAPAGPVPLSTLKKQRKPAAKGGQPSARWSKADLYAKAKELKVAGRSSMSKEELLAALKMAVSPGTA